MSERSMPVCLCLTGSTLRENLAALDRYRGLVDMVELRADCLVPGEKFLLRSFPEKAGLPCVLTVRRRSDGGHFEEGEGVRLVMIAKALSYARADASANFAYADLEDDFRVSAIEEACKTFGTRIIRSKHYVDGMPADLDVAWAPLAEDPDEIPKLAVTPKGSTDLASLIRWCRTLPERDRLVIGMGTYGYPTRLLASCMGSMFTFTSALGAGLPSAAPGQIDPVTFASVYRGRETCGRSDLYALIGGSSIMESLSPSLHNGAFRKAGKDAVYIPFPSDAAAGFMDCLDLLGVHGAAVTVPFKEEVLPYLASQSKDVMQIGACNTLVRREEGWAGYNTDADGFEKSLLEFLGRTDLAGLRVTLVGSGGAAKSVALCLSRRGATCVILNRTMPTARALARKYGFAWGPLDDRSLDVVADHSDLIVQATSVGMAGGQAGDPLDWYEFSGREAVFDLIYRPARTAFLERAAAAGCRVKNGYDMLRYQASGQFRIWMGAEPPDEFFSQE
ncbi:MAG: type I 3-dehydroquinate dehydratase [Rectinemataceae bacterium]